MVKEKYKIVLIDGFLMLYGDAKADLKNIDMFGLKVGDKVKKIGRLSANGKVTSSTRIFEVKPYMTYSGMFFIDEDEYMAFLMPEEYFKWDLFTPRVDIYSLFSFINIEDNEPELILQNIPNLSIEIFKAQFETVK